MFIPAIWYNFKLMNMVLICPVIFLLVPLLFYWRFFLPSCQYLPRLDTFPSLMFTLKYKWRWVGAGTLLLPQYSLISNWWGTGSLLNLPTRLWCCNILNCSYIVNLFCKWWITNLPSVEINYSGLDVNEWSCNIAQSTQRIHYVGRCVWDIRPHRYVSGISNTFG